jgi:hypothetical protein
LHFACIVETPCDPGFQESGCGKALATEDIVSEFPWGVYTYDWGKEGDK